MVGNQPIASEHPARLVRAECEGAQFQPAAAGEGISPSMIAAGALLIVPAMFTVWPLRRLLRDSQALILTESLILAQDERWRRA